MTTWKRYAFRNFKTHAVCDALEIPLALEMTGRGAELVEFPAGYAFANPAPISEWGFDVGGACHLHRPIEEFMWCGLKIWIPSQDVVRIAARLGALEFRRFATGEQYHKLTVWNHCTVMTPEQAESLRLLVVSRIDVAEERDRLFAAAVNRADAQGVS